MAKTITEIIGLSVDGNEKINLRLKQPHVATASFQLRMLVRRHTDNMLLISEAYTFPAGTYESIQFDAGTFYNNASPATGKDVIYRLSGTGVFSVLAISTPYGFTDSLNAFATKHLMYERSAGSRNSAASKTTAVAESVLGTYELKNGKKQLRVTTRGLVEEGRALFDPKKATYRVLNMVGNRIYGAKKSAADFMRGITTVRAGKSLPMVDVNGNVVEVASTTYLSDGSQQVSFNNVYRLPVPLAAGVVGEARRKDPESGIEKVNTSESPYITIRVAQTRKALRNKYTAIPSNFKGINYVLRFPSNTVGGAYEWDFYIHSDEFAHTTDEDLITNQVLDGAVIPYTHTLQAYYIKSDNSYVSLAMISDFRSEMELAPYKESELNAYSVSNPAAAHSSIVAGALMPGISWVVSKFLPLRELRAYYHGRDLSDNFVIGFGFDEGMTRLNNGAFTPTAKFPSDFPDNVAYVRPQLKYTREYDNGAFWTNGGNIQVPISPFSVSCNVSTITSKTQSITLSWNARGRRVTSYKVEVQEGRGYVTLQSGTVASTINSITLPAGLQTTGTGTVTYRVTLTNDRGSVSSTKTVNKNIVTPISVSVTYSDNVVQSSSETVQLTINGSGPIGRLEILTDRGSETAQVSWVLTQQFNSPSFPMTVNVKPSNGWNMNATNGGIKFIASEPVYGQSKEYQMAVWIVQ
ncbi:hypothetical protein V6R21_24895 [Limibacter armeniacum]|uniref:hypothetical protein n=1 Tax=Limibacter armeniacum TaxID=466084 RepID=UPI002FE602FE